MFYFKDSENPNCETKIGPTGSFIKYVEKPVKKDVLSFEEYVKNFKYSV